MTFLDEMLGDAVEAAERTDELGAGQRVVDVSGGRGAQQRVDLLGGAARSGGRRWR